MTLLVVQAPLPSAERVASAVELAMDMSKRGLGTVARECYYYVQVGWYDRQTDRMTGLAD